MAPSLRAAAIRESHNPVNPMRAGKGKGGSPRATEEVLKLLAAKDSIDS